MKISLPILALALLSSVSLPGIAERQTGRLRHFDPREVEQRFLALIESLVG